MEWQAKNYRALLSAQHSGMRLPYIIHFALETATCGRYFMHEKYLVSNKCKPITVWKWAEKNNGQFLQKKIKYLKLW